MAEAKFDPLIAELAALTTVTDSAIALMDQFAADVLAAKDDPAEIAEIVAGYQAQSGKLGAAVASHTPAAPTEPTPEVAAARAKKRSAR